MQDLSYPQWSDAELRAGHRREDNRPIRPVKEGIVKYTRPGLNAVDHLILTRIAQFGQNSPPQDFSAADLDDDALRAEYTRIRERGNQLSSQDTRTDEETTELTELASRVDLVTAELAVREERARTEQQTRDKFATLPDLEPSAATPPPPAADPEPVTPPATDPPATITASAPAVPSVATMAPTADPVPPVTPQRSSEFSVTLTPDGAGALGMRYGDEVSVSDVARAVTASFRAYGSAGGGSSSKRAIAQFTRERGDEWQLRKEPEHDYGVFARLTRENRLDGGSLLAAWRKQLDQGMSLTAAAGWCAPSENLYDLCSLWSMDGMLDLPTATARRGGFNYTNQPTYAELEASTSFTILTEAQVIADTPKNCAEIPCPTFTDTRLDVAVSCITGAFLQAAGYPELVETWVDGLLTNHAHKLNENIIGRIVTEAGAAVVIPAQGVVTGAGAVGLAADSSATASILSAVDLARTDMRYQSRMSFNHTFEVILPEWVLTQFRADVIRKNGWSMENAALADARIVSWFAARNIRPQFVYDWQDALSGLAAGPGGVAPITALPTTVNFLIYPAGAVVLARQDVVTLTNVYDSANLTQNLYTRLFTEEGFNLLFPCGDVRQYTAQACPSGATAYQAYTACAAPVAA